MSPVATVISGAPEALKRPIFKFAAKVCQTDEERLDLIFQPGIESAITNWNRACPSQAFAAREIVETRIRESARNVRTACVIIVPIERIERECFEHSRDIALTERDIIRSWIGGTHPFFVFCVTPRLHFIPAE